MCELLLRLVLLKKASTIWFCHLLGMSSYMLSLLCRNPHGNQPPVESCRSHFCCPVFWCRPRRPHRRTKSAGTIVMRTLSWRRKTGRVQIGTTKLLLRQQVAREKQRWTCPLLQRASVWTCMLLIQKMQWGSSLSGTLEKKLSERISITSWKRKNLVFEQSFMCLFGAVVFSRGNVVIPRKTPKSQQLIASCEILK